jgi:hypothetical protein
MTTKKRFVVIKSGDPQKELDREMRRQIARSEQPADVKLGHLTARDMVEDSPAMIFADANGRETGRHTTSEAFAKAATRRVSFNDVVFTKAAEPFTPKRYGRERVGSLDLNS